MMNDYERRFQRSLQKLIIPSWFNVDSRSSSKYSITPTIISPTPTDESSYQPETIPYRRPQSYRSCRSSLATSPSPSIRSWHPNHLHHDGLALSFRHSSSRRPIKYEKGIDRVSKSSHWYRPMHFVSTETQLNTSKSFQIIILLIDLYHTYMDNC